MGTDGAISGPPPSYWVPPVARICHVSVFLYILIIVSLQSNPIQGNDNRTERPFIILSILAKVGADLKAHFRFQANKLSVTNTIQISTLLHICLSFFPLFVAGNSMKPFPLLIAALTIRWRISDTLSSVSVFQCFSQ